jgi:uncharacterized RDD family membrane protein YckC
LTVPEAGTPGGAPVADAGAAPSLRRRLACLLYESVLLFGVVVIAGLLYGMVVGQRHALAGRTGLQATMFLVFGAYFVYFWSRSGQTLAMQTWHLRVVGPDGQPPRPLRAAWRYVLAWLWVLPAPLAAWLAGLHGTAPILLSMVFGLVAYAALAWLHPQRQFWHDAAAGTRLVTALPPARPQNRPR